MPQMTLPELKMQINRILSVAKMLATITRTDADDEAVEFFEYLVNDTQVMERADQWIKNRQAANQ